MNSITNYLNDLKENIDDLDKNMIKIIINNFLKFGKSKNRFLSLEMVEVLLQPRTLSVISERVLLEINTIIRTSRGSKLFPCVLM